MITIDKCMSCKKIHNDLYGPCPIYEEIQRGMIIIEQSMVKAKNNRKISSVVVKDHWLAECNFECEFYESTKLDKLSNIKFKEGDNVNFNVVVTEHGHKESRLGIIIKENNILWILCNKTKHIYKIGIGQYDININDISEE